MAALVAAERHLWLTLSDIKDRDRVFLLDAPLSPSGLFGDAVDTVVDRHQEAGRQAAAFRRFLPRRSLTQGAAGREQPLPRAGSSYREGQKESVAARAPPRRRSRGGKKGARSKTSQPKPDLRTVLQARKSSTKKPWRFWTRAYEGSPRWGGTAVTAAHGACFAPVPSGDRSANPATYGVSGRSGLQRAHISVSSARKRSGAEMLATPSGVSTAASLAFSCRCAVPGYQTSHSNYTRGQSRETGSLSTLSGSVETTAKCVSMGPAYCRERLQNPVRFSPASIQRGEFHFGGPRAGSGNGTGGKHSLKEGGHRGGVSSRKRVRVLQPVLHSSKEGWRVASHFRSAAVEPLSQQTEVQDAYSQAGRVSNQVRGLVCRDRSKRRILPRLHPSHSQEVPEVCFQGQSLPISGTSLRPSTLTSHFYEVCGRRLSSAAATGRPHTQLYRRLVDSRSIRAKSGSTSRCCSRSYESVGVKTEPQEKCAFSITENHLSGGGVGFDHDAGTYCMSPARIESILTTVRRVKEGQSLTVKQFQRLLGLMAAASNVIPIGLLYMRPLQWWLKTKGFSPRGNPLRMIKVTRRCLRALDMWRQPWFLSQGPVLGAPCRRVTLATDASLTGWGAVMSGHPARGLWRGHHLAWHINRLEMLAVFQALKYFLPDLRGHHVLVRTDNTAVVSYINHQGGLRSRHLYRLAHQILVWAQGKLLSLRAVYIPGHLNVGADTLSRQGPLPGEWMLHTEVVKQIWRVFGQAQVDLFATQETAQCPLWYSLLHPAPLGLDAMVQTWPRLRLYAFPPVALLPGVLERVRRDGVRLLLVAPFWPGRVWFSDLISLLDGSPWEIPVRRDLLSQAGCTLVHPHPELWRLWVWPLRGHGS